MENFKGPYGQSTLHPVGMRKLNFAYRTVTAVSAGLLIGTCSPDTRPKSRLESVVDDPWSITSRSPDPRFPAYLTNGIVGLRVGADGKSFVEPCFELKPRSGKDSETLIEPIRVGSTLGDPAAWSAANYSQTLNLHEGSITTHYGNKTNVIVLEPGAPSPQFTESVGGKQYWRGFWKTDIQVEGPVEDQLAIRSFLFYLRTSIDPASQYSVGPFGLSNAKYDGHVFWDADTWIFPALAFIDPARASVIPAYRLRQMDAYRLNSGSSSLRVPWESAITGREVSPPNSSPEIHVTGSVAFALDRAAALGLADPKIVAKFCEEASHFYLSRAQKDGSGLLNLRQVGSVDESHTVDNDLYTNLLAQWLANGRRWVSAPSARYVVPEDQRSLQTYSGDLALAHKQAAAVLAIYPLQYPQAEKSALAILDRYAPLTISAGPAMSESIEALILARTGKSDRAYDTWLKSWKDFLKSPHMQFSEHRATHETYFLTGAAGCLQTVLYGFLGFRIDSQKDASAAWSTPLKQGKWLNVAPHLPKAWKSVRLTGLQVLGKRYTMTFSPSRVKVELGD